jgi:SAM-dependent methyltransferase
MTEAQAPTDTADANDQAIDALGEVALHLDAASSTRAAARRAGPVATAMSAARRVESAWSRILDHHQDALAELSRAVEHQVEVGRDNAARLGGIEGTVTELRHDTAELAERTLATESANAESLARLVEVQTELKARHAETGALRDEVAALRREVDTARDLAATVRAQQAVVLRTARQALADQGISVAQLTELSRELGTDHEGLYQELEDEFRGTRQAIRDKLSPYVADLAALPPGGPVVDVGCGRGEWLELLAAEGIEAYGVDLNQVVVDRCRARGLDVRAGDALVHLRQVDPGSVRAVTSFHVVEHLGLDTLVGLIDAALVALAPGGLLVFETPNPTNVIVGAASFYLDPTHLKPLHPQFLEFLVRSRGFAEVEGRYLNPAGIPGLALADLDPAADPARNQQLVDHLNWALTGPLDFGIVARKALEALPAEDAAETEDTSLDPGPSTGQQ